MISAYSSISRGTSGGQGHPQPATTFAGIISASNLDFLRFVPMSCVIPGGMSFYWRMCIKTLIPPGVTFLLFLWPFSLKVRCQSWLAAARTVAYVVLLGIEVVAPSVATTVLQTFACDRFDGDWYLRTELTLSCDDSVQRRAWQAYAVIATFVYCIGESKCAWHRHGCPSS